MSENETTPEIKTPIMRAKFVVDGQTGDATMETLSLRAVTDAPFNPDGESEDNSFARWTPSGSISITITNPALFGKFINGQKFYVDFTEAK